MGKGGILADDMGLGKTMQCAAFLAGALHASRQGALRGGGSGGGSRAAPGAGASGAPVPVRALVVAPKTLLAHWQRELRVCGLGPATHSFFGSSEGERAAALRTLTRCVRCCGGGCWLMGWCGGGGSVHSAARRVWHLKRHPQPRWWARVPRAPQVWGRDADDVRHGAAQRGAAAAGPRHRRGAR
jgi:hypothetical protein